MTAVARWVHERAAFGWQQQLTLLQISKQQEAGQQAQGHRMPASGLQQGFPTRLALSIASTGGSKLLARLCLAHSLCVCRASTRQLRTSFRC